MMDGRLDTGAYASDAQRQAKLEIRNAPLSDGAEIALVDEDKSETFVVQSIVNLLD